MTLPQSLVWPQIQFDDEKGVYYSCAHRHKHIDEPPGNGESLLKVWVNTTLGEPWGDRGKCLEWEHLFERRPTLPLHRNGETPSYSFLNRLKGIQAS